MDASRVDMYMMANAKFFDSGQLYAIKDMLMSLDENQWNRVVTLSFNDPTITLLVSVLVGPFGVDRFMIGDTVLGVVKLLTCGGFGIWTIVDWFLIMGLTRQKNADKLQQAIHQY